MGRKGAGLVKRRDGRWLALLGTVLGSARSSSPVTKSVPEPSGNTSILSEDGGSARENGPAN